MVATYSYIQAYVYIQSQCWTYSCMHAVEFYGNQLASQLQSYSYIAIASWPGSCMYADNGLDQLQPHFKLELSSIIFAIYHYIYIYIYIYTHTLNEYQLCSQLSQSVVLKICDWTDASWLQPKSLATYIASCQLQLCICIE